MALFARIAVGVVFVAHGWQKIQDGLTATAVTFDMLGVPLPTAAATYAAFAELLGGTALIIGLGLPVTGLLLFLDMAGAFYFVNAQHGLIGQDGFELVLVLGAASLLFAAGAGGRLTLDQIIFQPRRTRPDTDHQDDDTTPFLPPEEPRRPQRELPTDIPVAGRPIHLPEDPH
ncbi:DoxX family protein [Actinocorallia lasiicapitis]